MRYEKNIPEMTSMLCTSGRPVLGLGSGLGLGLGSGLGSGLESGLGSGLGSGYDVDPLYFL